MEIPHDWGATKRPLHAGGVAQGPEEVPCGKKQKVVPDGKEEELPKVSACRLGPKGVFNAVLNDNPERGQLKQMVMEQLSKPCSSSEAHQREMEVHCLLSKLPYQKMLSDLFTNQVPTFSTATSSSSSFDSERAGQGGSSVTQSALCDTCI